MNKPLKQASQEYFAKQSLSDSQIDELLDSSYLSRTESKPRLFKKYFSASSAATVLFAILVWLLYPGINNDLSFVIAKEVAKNHLKLKPLEVTSDDFEQVKNYFTELDFSASPSDYLSQYDLKMLGGRYCSIQSVTAAQLRYQNKNGEALTLYQVGYDKDIFGQLPDIRKDSPIVHYVDGLQVKIWVEKGLLLASVSR